MKFSVRNKMLISFAMVIILVIAFGMYSLNIIQNLRDDSSDMLNEAFTGISMSHAIKTHIAEYRGAEYRHITFDDVKIKNEVESELQARVAEVEELLIEYGKMDTSEQGKQMIEDLETDINQYLNISQKVLGFSEKEDQKSASDLMLSDSLTEYYEILDSSDQLVSYNGQIVEDGYIQIEEAYKRSRLVSLIFMVFTILISVLMAILLSNNISKRLVIIGRAIANIEELDLTIDEQAVEEFQKFKGNDELTDAANSVIAMQNILMEIVTDIKNAVFSVDESAKDVAENIGEVTNSFEGITEATEELAKGAANQANDAEEAAYKLNNLSQTVEEAVRNSRTVEEGVGQIVSANSEGQIAINNLKDIGLKNVAVLDEVLAQVDILDRESASIAGITETISDIASQTNLLALNAMIEAARAGEDGKGFAVVATEIRKLAEQVDDNTGNIEATINSINREINKTKDKMEDAKGVIGESQDATDMTEEKFMVIDNSIRTIVDRVQDVLQNIDDIDKDKEIVVDSIQNISAVTEESSASTQEISASFQEQSAIMEEILNAARNVEAVATNADNILDRFTV